MKNVSSKSYVYFTNSETVSQSRYCNLKIKKKNKNIKKKYLKVCCIGLFWGLTRRLVKFGIIGKVFKKYL